MPARWPKNTNVQDWNQATNLVITGKAGGQIMGDWAQGEFQVAGKTAGKDYTCLPGLGLNEVIATGGDAFYFPLLKDAEKSKAQEVLAETLLDPKTQVAFNLKKGSLPVRGDVDLNAANDCMKKGLEILAKGNVIPGRTSCCRRTRQKQMEDLFAEFFAKPDMTVRRRAEALRRHRRLGRLTIGRNPPRSRPCQQAGPGGRTATLTRTSAADRR